MEFFTPISGFIGGCLIGIAAFALLYFNQRICGISGIFNGILPPLPYDAGWRACFILGLLSGGVLLRIFYPVAYSFSLEPSLDIILLGGFLVGFGSRVGNGCTSGHGVCGLGRMSERSLVATVVFFITGLITATTFYTLRG